VVVLAAGAGSRVGAASNKVLLPVAGVPVLAWSVRHVLALPYVEELLVVHAPGERAPVLDALSEHCAGATVTLLAGGGTRHASEWQALQVLAGPIDAGTIDVVAVHDAARPLAGPELFDAVVRAAHEHGGALPVRSLPGLIGCDPGRRRDPGVLVGVQTPQAFRAGPLLEAYRRAAAEGFEGTDTAACVERYAGLAAHAVDGPATNVKVTFPEDVALAERLLGR
jgi:2-C-methyl-D-erythritol 4-phosphate cytidylyltransferase